VLLHIDEVIALIRAADEPKAALIERFALSERQADDILDIRLRQLARLEAIRIEQELKELRAEGAKLGDILASPAALKRTVVREIEADAKAYGDERRTLIEAQKRAVAEVRVVDEPVTVVVSLKGWVRAMKGHEVEGAQLAFKAGDALYGTFGCRSTGTLLVFGSNGRVYSVAVASLPSGRGDGAPVTSLIELEAGTQPAHYFAGGGAELLLLANTGGFGLLARASDLVSRQRGGKGFLVLEGEEKPLPPVVVGGEQTSRVACLTLLGRLLVFGVDELKLQPNGGRGLTLIDVDENDALVSVAVFASALQVLGSGRGGKPRDETLRGAALDDYVGRRARKGRKQHVMPTATRVVAADRQ
jgi:topoisomerase-4 subunit A